MGSQEGASLCAAACMNKIWCAHRVVLHCCSDATWNNISKAKEERRELCVCVYNNMWDTEMEIYEVTAWRQWGAPYFSGGNPRTSNVRLHLFNCSGHLGPQNTFSHFLFLLASASRFGFTCSSVQSPQQVVNSLQRRALHSEVCGQSCEHSKENKKKPHRPQHLSLSILDYEFFKIWIKHTERD